MRFRYNQSFDLQSAHLEFRGACRVKEKTMRTVGKRKMWAVSTTPSGESLKAGCIANDLMHQLPTGSTTHVPKGIYRFQSHEEANLFDAKLLALKMRDIANERK